MFFIYQSHLAHEKSHQICWCRMRMSIIWVHGNNCIEFLSMMIHWCEKYTRCTHDATTHIIRTHYMLKCHHVNWKYGYESQRLLYLSKMFLLYNFIHSYKDTNEAYPIFIYHIHCKYFFGLSSHWVVCFNIMTTMEIERDGKNGNYSQWATERACKQNENIQI